MEQRMLNLTTKNQPNNSHYSAMITNHGRVVGVIGLIF